MLTIKLQNWTWWLIPLLFVSLLFPAIIILNQEFLGATRRMDNLIDGYERSITLWIRTREILRTPGRIDPELQMELIRNTELLRSWVGSDELHRMKKFTEIAEPLGFLQFQFSHFEDVILLSPDSFQEDGLSRVDETLKAVRVVLGEYRTRLDGGFSFLVQAQVLLIFLMMVLIVIALEERSRGKLVFEASRRTQIEIARAQEEERNRIALNLHDDIAQELSWMRLKMAGNNADSDQIQIVDSMILKIRGISQYLRTPNFRTEFFDDAVRDLIVAAEGRSGLTIKYLPGERHPENQPDIYGQLYRIIQECLNNAGKHAGDCRVFMEVQEEAKVVYFEYRDDGKGFNPADLEGNERLGLKGMRNRVQITGGEMRISTSPGKGLCLSCRIPFKGESL